jgi:hypothetical protein
MLMHSIWCVEKSLKVENDVIPLVTSFMVTLLQVEILFLQSLSYNGSHIKCKLVHMSYPYALTFYVRSIEAFDICSCVTLWVGDVMVYGQSTKNHDTAKLSTRRKKISFLHEFLFIYLFLFF